MSHDEKFIDDIIEFIESTISENLEEKKFINSFREKIKNYVKKKL